MKERPILFSAPMVRAILEGWKTQTRRVVKPQPKLAQLLTHSGLSVWHNERGRPIRNPYGQPGDRLWVRETWQAVNGNDRARHIMTHPRPNVGWLEYAATPHDDEPAYKWRPSIHMPRWASRIDLEVTGVRVERLQDISESDAAAEGAAPGLVPPDGGSCPYYEGFRALWELIHGAGSWASNPWVWVVDFKRVKP